MSALPHPHRLAPIDFRALASFRQALRKFLYFSASAAKKVGLTTQHYQALLALKAASIDGQFTVGDLSKELLLRHHSAVELLNRLETRALVRRERSSEDRRKVHIYLTPKGESLIGKLAASHREELRSMVPKMQKALAIVAKRRK